jgi:hypothetical protein
LSVSYFTGRDYQLSSHLVFCAFPWFFPSWTETEIVTHPKMVMVKVNYYGFGDDGDATTPSHFSRRPSRHYCYDGDCVCDDYLSVATW